MHKEEGDADAGEVVHTESEYWLYTYTHTYTYIQYVVKETFVDWREDESSIHMDYYYRLRRTEKVVSCLSLSQ
jgi:hypothetical protein